MRKKTYVAVLGRWSEAGAITPLLIFLERRPAICSG